MKYRKIGNLKVSAIGLGCMGMSHAYGEKTETKEGIELISKAVDMGVNFFDTAECYGPFENEELVGEALKPYKGKVVIATKFGVYLEHGSTGAPIPDARPEVIRKSIDGSLKRLQTECIDLYYQHRADPNIPVEDVAGVMQELMTAGKIKHWGISQATEQDIRRAHKICPLTAIQNRYSMMSRNFENLFPVLEELNIGFVAFSPLANGFLSDKYTKDSKFDAQTDYRANMPQFSREGFEANRELLELLRHTARSKNATPAQISLAWMLAKKPYIVPIPGGRKLEHLQDNIKSADVEITPAELKELDQALAKVKMSEVFGGTKQSD